MKDSNAAHDMQRNLWQIGATSNTELRVSELMKQQKFSINQSGGGP